METLKEGSSEPTNSEKKDRAAVNSPEVLAEADGGGLLRQAWSQQGGGDP